MWRRNPTSHVNQLSLSSWVMSPEKIQLRYGDTVDDLFSFVQVKLFQFRCYKLQGEGCSLPTIAANDYPKRTSLPPCTTVYNRCTPSPVSGHQHAALSRRGGRQRGRLPRARGRQDRQGGAQTQALGGRRGAALQYIQPSPLYMCTVGSSCLYRTTHY